MPIGEGSASSYELNDLDLLLMEEYRITNHVVDNGCNSEGKKCKKCKNAILKNMKRHNNRVDTPELALVVEELLPENILIIVEQFTILQNDIVKVSVLIERDILDLECIRKRILASSFDDTNEIGIEELVTSICLIARNRSDHNPREGRSELIDKDSRSQAINRIATLIVNREFDT